MKKIKKIIRLGLSAILIPGCLMTCNINQVFGCAGSCKDEFENKPRCVSTPGYQQYNKESLFYCPELDPSSEEYNKEIDYTIEVEAPKGWTEYEICSTPLFVSGFKLLYSKVDCYDKDSVYYNPKLDPRSEDFDYNEFHKAVMEVWIPGRYEANCKRLEKR